MSSVTTSVEYPEAFARSRKLAHTSSSVGKYSWYHRLPSPLAPATCSKSFVAAVEWT